ncbi:MAG: hypothetical protein K2I55_05645 [Phocaeicola sp.]|nr:hypothetical protein [Phocaeicola sp.]
MNSFAENIARFEQQETETADDMALPCNSVFKTCGFLCIFSLLAALFGPVFSLQLHQFRG